MPDLPTRADYVNIGSNEAVSRSAERPVGQRITTDAIFTPGSDINIAVTVAAAMAEEVTRQICLRAAALLFDSAEDEDLDRVVLDRTFGQVPRKEASPAVVTLSFSRSSGSFPVASIDAGTKVRTTGGVEFATRFSVAFAASQTGPITVEAEAEEAGTAGNVAAGTIVEFVTAPSDPEIQVTNPDVAAGGDDRETNARYRDRAKQWFGNLSRGTLEAIEFGALTVEGVRQATAVEDVDADGDPTGRVSLYVADEQGQANSALTTAVETALNEYRAAGVVANVYASAPSFQAIEYLLRFESSVDSTAAFAAVQQATLAAVNRLQPNERLPVSLLYEVARSVPGVIVQDDAIVTPVGDVIPAIGEVIRTRLDLITSS